MFNIAGILWIYQNTIIFIFKSLFFFFPKQIQSRSDLIILCFSSLPPYVSAVKAVIDKVSGSRAGFTVVLEYRFHNMQFPSSEVNGLFSRIRFLRHRSDLQRHIGTKTLFKDILLIWSEVPALCPSKVGWQGIPQTTARARLNRQFPDNLMSPCPLASLLGH